MGCPDRLRVRNVSGVTRLFISSPCQVLSPGYNRFSVPEAETRRPQPSPRSSIYTWRET
jgi:hypothetical protein